LAKGVRMLKKICMLGDFAVGKTSMIRRYVLDEFDDRYITTLGTKISKKVLHLGKFELTFQIWDIIGNINYHKLQSQYYLGSEGAFIIFDVTRRDTFDNVMNWADAFLKVAPKAKFILVANKVDLEPTFDHENEVKDLAEVYGGHAFSTSAKTGENVEAAFRTLAEELLGPKK
jgi:small GTP-binding protein